MADRVAVITSISPTHHLGDMQQRCAQSWIDAGLTYVTINSPGDNVAPPPGGRQVLASPARGFRRPYIHLDSILEEAKRYEVAIVTNSDIELRGDITGHLDFPGVVVGNRQDHNGDYRGQEYPHGFDLFILRREFIETLPRTLFMLGQTWWDYWIPWRAIQQKVPMRRIKEPILWHHRHPQQHDGQEWVRMTDHFVWLEQIHKGQKPPYITGKIYQDIRRHAR